MEIDISGDSGVFFFWSINMIKSNLVNLNMSIIVGVIWGFVEDLWIDSDFILVIFVDVLSVRVFVDFSGSFKE